MFFQGRVAILTLLGFSYSIIHSSPSLTETNDLTITIPLRRCFFWTIISVGARRYQGDAHLLNSLAGPVSRLVWSTLADIPQSYHVVKALCLLCTWPFPISSTSTDPTFMLCGMMMQVAMQLGLHRPSHTQDFSKFRVELIEEELRDKVRTWAITNIVAQRYAFLKWFSVFDC